MKKIVTVFIILIIICLIYFIAKNNKILEITSTELSDTTKSEIISNINDI